jgi:hypothetical protein
MFQFNSSTLFQTRFVNGLLFLLGEKPQNGQKGVVNLVPTISRVNNNMFRIRDCTVFSPLENFQARNTRKQELELMMDYLPPVLSRERLAFVNHLFF